MTETTQSKRYKKYIRETKKQMAEKREKLEEIKKLNFDTIAVHGAYTAKEAIENNQGSIIEPTYFSTSQAYRDSDELEAGLSYDIPRWTYSRIHNPTIAYLEETIALLEGYGFEGDTSCLCTSSGMSAIFQAVDPLIAKKKETLNEPRNIVATAQCYGGTFQQFSLRKMDERGVEIRWVTDQEKTESWEKLIDEDTRLLYGEMPSNPQQGCFDIESIAELAHENDIPLVVDATIATPALMRPLKHGADIVVHSTTKSMTSSGCAIGGAIISKNNITSKFLEEEKKEDYATWLKLWPHRDNGPAYSPMNATFQLNDLRTLRSKMKMLSQNTEKVAKFLDGHSMVEKVDYLGLPSHPLHKLAGKYMELVDSGEKCFGHLMSFNVKGGIENTREFFDNLERIYRATDLGRIKSIATIPAISTHQQQGEEGRELAGIAPNMVRLCVGGEHPEDTIADLDQALNKI